MAFHHESNVLDHLETGVVIFWDIYPNSVEPQRAKGVVQQANKGAGAEMVMPEVFPANEKIGSGL